MITVACVLGFVFLVSGILSAVLMVYDMGSPEFPFTPKNRDRAIKGSFIVSLGSAVLLLALSFAITILEVNGVKL